MNVNMKWSLQRTAGMCVAISLLLASLILFIPCVHAERIKDIANFEGVRENQLLGYGLVVGLNGTGDKGKTAVQSISSMLQRMGVSVNPNDIKTKSIAAVVITATLPPFAKPGIKIDALVSTIGDAKLLEAPRHR